MVGEIIIAHEEGPIDPPIEATDDCLFSYSLPGRSLRSTIRIRVEQKRFLLAPRPLCYTPVCLVGVAKHLHHVWLEAMECACDFRIVDLPVVQPCRTSTDRQKLVLISIEQRRVPLELRLKLMIELGFSSPITTEEHPQIDVFDRGEFSVPWRKMLDRVTDHNGKAKSHSCLRS